MDCYAIYLRKSRNDDPNTSIEETLYRHEKLLLETAKKMNLSIAKIYREVISGETISQRPEMQHLLEDIDKGLYKGVLVVEIERLARGSSIDQGIIAQSFQLSGTIIITPYKIIDPNDEFDSENLEFNLFMSRREYKTINRRLMQGKLASIKEGKYLGPSQPYGYIRAKIDGSKGITLSPHPEQAPIVQLIFELYTKGEDGQRLGLHAIASKLNAMGIPSAKGGVWATNALQVILKNPVYIGKIRWNARKRVRKVVDGVVKITRPKNSEPILIDGMHPSIINEETFEAANNLLNYFRATPNPHEYELKNPLSGIVECALCGKKLTRLYYPSSNQGDVLTCPTNTCKNMSCNLSAVESAIIQSLQNLLQEFKTKSKSKKKKNLDLSIFEKSLKKIEDEKKSLSEQLNKTYDLLEKGIYDTDTFLSRNKMLTEKMNELELKKKELNEQIEKIKIQESEMKNIIPEIKNIIDTYYSTTPAEKNIMLKKIFDKVTFLKTQRGTKKNPLGNAELVIYQR